MVSESISVGVLILFSTQIDYTHSSVSWNMTTYPAIFGQDVMLTCYTFHPLNSLEDCPIRVWSGGSDGQRLMYNGISSNEEKYEEKANLSSSQFSLIINNFSIPDINVNYTCLCGFSGHTEKLQLDEQRFKYTPDAANVLITLYNDTLKIRMKKKLFYPLPTCSVYIGNRVVSNKVRLTYRKSGLFYSVSLVSEYKHIVKECYKPPRLQCDLNGLHITFEGNVTHCSDFSTETKVNENSTLNEENVNKEFSSLPKSILIVIVPCIFLVAFSVFCVLARKTILRITANTCKKSNEKDTPESIPMYPEEGAQRKMK